MREVKFRAWDKRTKQMFDHEDFLEEGRLLVRMAVKLAQGEPDVANAKGGIMLHTDDKNMEHMQYTGLKDKNGKEIYEGDIQEFKNGYRAAVEFKHGMFGINPVIKYDRESFIELNIYTHSIEEGNALNIIGNIYENPEHLEAK